MSVGEAQDLKAGWAGHWQRGHTWDEFDALPPSLKRLFHHAAYNYGCAMAVDALAEGAPIRDVDARTAAGFREDQAREAARLYGPAHPQAGA